MKITLRDIAEKAGVSPATVSNALSGNNRISEATRLRVLIYTEMKVSMSSLMNGARFLSAACILYPAGGLRSYFSCDYTMFTFPLSSLVRFPGAIILCKFSPLIPEKHNCCFAGVWIYSHCNRLASAGSEKTRRPWTDISCL